MTKRLFVALSTLIVTGCSTTVSYSVNPEYENTPEFREFKECMSIRGYDIEDTSVSFTRFYIDKSDFVDTAERCSAFLEPLNQ